MLAHEEVLDDLEAQLGARSRERLRERLGDEAFTVAYDAGHRLSARAAVALALKDEGGP
jgi:hypothetical protein